MMNRHEKLLCIAKALATHYGVPFDPDADEEQELHKFIKGILAKTNGNLKRCRFCNSVLQRKYINGKLKYVCKNCQKTFAIKEC